MKILAIETSTDACSCALWLDGELRERFEIAPRAHGTLILSMVESLLAEGGLHLGGLDGFAFGCGPGSFTGLRIAAGVIQGLAFAVELPVAPISSLAALAQGVRLPLNTDLDSQQEEMVGVADQVLAIQDARMGEVYFGAFRRASDSMVSEISSSQVCRPEAISLPEGKGTWVVVGGGWDTHGNALYHALAGHEIIVLHEFLYPHAGDVARLGAVELSAGRGVRAEQAVPIYLRDNVANKMTGS